MELTTEQAKHLIELIQTGYEFDSLTMAHEYDRHNVAILTELTRAYPAAVFELEREHHKNHVENVSEYAGRLYDVIKDNDLTEEIKKANS